MTNKTGNTPRSAAHDVERRLMTYALTAGAALVASASNAAAAPITRVVNLPIPGSTSPVPVALDVDNNGVDDFLFSNLIGDSSLPGFVGVQGTSANNGVWGIPFGDSKSLGLGLTSPKGSFQWGPTFLSEKSSSLVGLSQNSKIALAEETKGGQLVPLKAGLPGGEYYPLLLSFDIEGQQHFGWARISTPFVGPNELSANILDVGWESDPNTDIHVPDPTPEPGTLGMLALGAAGMLAMRRKMKKS